MGDLDIHTRDEHILHGSLPQGGQCPAEEKCSSHWGNLSKFWRLPVPALITLVMISNPAAVVGRPEANGHAPVPPHDALYTRFNPTKEVLLQVNKLIAYHINEDTSSQIPKSYCCRDAARKDILHQQQCTTDFLDFHIDLK